MNYIIQKNKFPRNSAATAIKILYNGFWFPFALAVCIMANKTYQSKHLFISFQTRNSVSREKKTKMMLVIVERYVSSGLGNSLTRQ